MQCEQLKTEQLTLTNCEICNKTFNYQDFQKHLLDVHNILFCQYVGLISEKINIKKEV